jgi:hypothetical protein
VKLNDNIRNMIRYSGAGREKGLILSSSLLVLLSFFYFFVAGSSLHAIIYTFLYRVTYEESFVTHVISLNTDAFILLSATLAWFYVSIKTGYMKYAILILFSVFLVSFILNMTTIALAGAVLTLPVVSCLIMLDRFRNKRILAHDPRLSIDYMTIVAIGLVCLGIVNLVVFVSTGITTVTVDKYPYAVYQQLLSILTPIVMAALVFCIPLKILLKHIISRMKISDDALVIFNFKVKLSTKRIAFYLSLCIVLAITVTLLPHLHIINPNNERLGVDTPRYVTWLMLMKNQSANPIDFALKTSADRPLTTILLFLLAEVTNADPFQVIEYSPTLFAPLLALVTFFLARELTGNDKISIVASLLSAISFQTLIGIYSGFYANWLALILGYLAFGFLIRCLKRPSKIGLVVLWLLMIGLLFAHTYTWTVMIAVAFVFVFVLHALNYYPRKHLLLLYIVLSSSIAVDVLKSSWTGSTTGLEADVSIGFGHGRGISQFHDRLVTLAETVQTYYGGAYANIAILGLVLYWLVRSNLRELANIFIMIFLSTALIPLFIGDYILQSRVLYDIPFHIPAAVSLYYIGRKNGKMISIALLLITGYLSLHVLANLGYVPPTNPLSFILNRN